MTRILVIFGACAGLCYNALWYFPVLIVIGGIATVTWDTWLRQQVDKFKAKRERKRREATSTERTVEEIQPVDMVHREGSTREGAEGLQRRTPVSGEKEDVSGGTSTNNGAVSTAPTRESASVSETAAAPVGADMVTHAISVKVGISIIAAFFGKLPFSQVRPRTL